MAAVNPLDAPQTAFALSLESAGDLHRLTRGPLVQNDPEIYDPSAVELDFLHKTIASDDEILKKTVLDFQRE